MVITLSDPEVKWQINAKRNEMGLSTKPCVCVQSGIFSIEIDDRLLGSTSVITLPISHPGRLNSALAVFINLCLSILDTEKKKLGIIFRNCTLI